MNKLGCFYFRKTESENLIGEYTNTSLNTVLTECANRNSEIENQSGFSGIYTTVWNSKTDKTQTLELEIRLRQNSNGKIYELKWKNGDKISFTGIGFVVGEILIGSYS